MKLFKYQLLAGGHAETDPIGNKVQYQTTPGQTLTFYSANPNLKKRDTPGMPPKFHLLGMGDVPDDKLHDLFKKNIGAKVIATPEREPVATADVFATMDQPALLKFAAEHDLDVSEAENVDQLRSMLREYEGTI